MYRSVRAAERIRTRGCAARRTRPPLRVRVVHRDDGSCADPPGAARAIDPARRGHRRATSRPTSSSCCRPAPRSSRADGAVDAVRPGPHRRARPHEPQRGARARRPRGGRRPGGHQRRRQRLRHRARPRVAARCSRRSSGPSRPAARPLGRTHRVPRLVAEQVAAADEDAWEEVHRRLHHWAACCARGRRRRCSRRSRSSEGLPGRVLAMVDGERRLTDLRHVGQLLHAAAMAEQIGVTALTAGCASASPRRRRTTPTRSAAGGWSPTPRPCRC